VYSDLIRVDWLGSVGFITTANSGRSGERSVYSDWLRVDRLGRVVGIATG